MSRLLSLENEDPHADAGHWLAHDCAEQKEEDTSSCEFSFPSGRRPPTRRSVVQQWNEYFARLRGPRERSVLSRLMTVPATQYRVLCPNNSQACLHCRATVADRTNTRN